MTSIDQIIIGGIDVCNYILQVTTTTNNVWRKTRRLRASSPITPQTCPGEDKRKFPSPLPVDSFF